MRYAGPLTAIASVAALALAGSAAADAGQNSGAEVFNFGQCVSTGFPAPSNGEFGPLILLFNQNGLIVNVPPGLIEGPASDPSGQIGCP